MRRRLVVLVLAQSLLWAAGGVAMLAVVAHEHVHRAESHDHAGALRSAAHGHLHGSEPDHDHQLATPPAARPVSASSAMQADTVIPNVPDPSFAPVVAGADGATASRLGPPAYLAHCALLT